MQERSADQDEETNVSGLNIWKPTRRRGQRKSSVIGHAQEYFKHINHLSTQMEDDQLFIPHLTKL